MTWQPPDDLYEDYSLWHTFGYGPEGEIERARKELASLGYDTSEDNIRELLELTRDLQRLVKVDCQDEVSGLSKVSKKLVVVGETPPFDVSLAISLAGVLLLAAQTGISALEYLQKRKSDSLENREILRSAMQKLLQKKSARDLIIEKTERWRISYRNEKKKRIAR